MHSWEIGTLLKILLEGIRLVQSVEHGTLKDFVGESKVFFFPYSS